MIGPMFLVIAGRMSTTFGRKVRKLKEVVARFDVRSNAIKLHTLQDLGGCDLPVSKALIGYCDLLLFLQAMPPNKKMLLAARKEMGRVTRLLSSSAKRRDRSLMNSGLPHTTQVSKFTHDLTTWLCNEPTCRIEMDGFEDAKFDLNEVLGATLPTMEQSETTSGLGNAQLLEALGIRSGKEVQFLLAELRKLNDRPRVKDLLFDGLGLYVRIQPTNRSFSRAYNTFLLQAPFFHDGLLKEFDQRELLDRALPDATALSASLKERLIRVVKLSMVLTDRETDPVTYLDERTLRLYALERGVMVAIYSMEPARQLALESYVGYTLFKNGYPAAYGGAWVFGGRADFGINIFEAFRGGESGYLMCQLLRVFRQVFSVDRFEIEPYQFGLDNPDGIATGAFWFYHKHGFRPTDPKLFELSETEVELRKKRKAHRTSKRVLIRFTESNMALVLGREPQLGVHDITQKVKRLIRTTYASDRARAEMESVGKFQKRTGRSPRVSADGARVLKEVALWAEAFQIIDAGKLDLLDRMIAVRPVDTYRYQDLLLRFFKKAK